MCVCVRVCVCGRWGSSLSKMTLASMVGRYEIHAKIALASMIGKYQIQAKRYGGGTGW